MLLQICTRIGRHLPRLRAATRTGLKAADREIEVFFRVRLIAVEDTRPTNAGARSRMCGEKCKETREEGEPASSQICVHENAYI